MESSEEAQALPTLRNWLAGLLDHPLHHFFGPPPSLVVPPGITYRWWRSPILTTVEEMLATLEQAQPAGLDHMRRKFRALRGRDLAARDKFHELRAELAAAAWLIELGVSFRFNTAAGPDFLLVAPSGREIAIEIGTRAPKGLGALAMDIYKELQRRNVRIKVQLFAEGYPPVSIRQDVRERILNRILHAVSNGRMHDVFMEMAIPERPQAGHPVCQVKVQLSTGEGMTTNTTAPPNSPHLQDIATEVVNKLLREERKRQQGRSRPTLLVADITRCEAAPTRELSAWARIFDGLWRNDDPFVALAAMVCYPNHLTPTMACSINPYGARTDLKDIVEALGPAGPAMGLSS